MSVTRTSAYSSTKHSSRIPNILKYGYSITDLMKYAEKQGNQGPPKIYPWYGYSYTVAYAHVLENLEDYLRMCDLMDIKPDKFPSDVKKVHDALALAYQAKRSVFNDRAISNLAKLAKPYIPNNSKYLDSDYIIMLPENCQDIIQEGQNMHNCVGSYIQKIASGKSLVFFIRQKDYPDESFITAEYAYGKLTQLFYKNNRRVTETKIIDIASDFCSKLYNSHKFNI